MTTITIELPEMVHKKLAERGISPDQLTETATRLLLLYVEQQLLPTGEAETRSSEQPEQKPLTLFDRRGAVPVSAPQDFEAIRRQVQLTQAGQIARD